MMKRINGWFKGKSRRKIIIASVQVVLVSLAIGVGVALVKRPPEVEIKAAQYEAAYFFETDYRSVLPGQDFWARLWLDTCRGEQGECAEVSSAGLTLYFDPSVLEVVEEVGGELVQATRVVAGEYVSGERVFPSVAENVVDYAQGTISFSGYGIDPDTGEPVNFSGAGVFISIHFRVVGNVGMTELRYDYIPFSDVENNTKDGSGVIWAGAFNEDILSLGEETNPLAMTVNVGGAITLRSDAAETGVDAGDTFQVGIYVNSGGVETVATDVVIDYPENLLMVIDEDGVTDGVQIRHGSLYEN